MKWRISRDEEGRITRYIYTKFYHKECYQESLRIQTEMQLNVAFRAANIAVFGMVQTENLYGSQNYRGSWFVVDTELGHFKIGWRKSVIEIRYDMIDPTYVAQTEETAPPGLEHVRTYEKLSEALKAFAQHLKDKGLLGKPRLPNLVHQNRD